MTENDELAGIDLKRVSFQVYNDDTNLDAYDAVTVYTRDPSLAWQVFKVTEVGQFEGRRLVTITNVEPTSPSAVGKNLESTGPDGEIKLKAADPQKLSQQWILHPSEDHTIITSRKDREYAITGVGRDKPAKLQRVQETEKMQMWTLYNKQ